jgi:hypothetical protein
VQNRSSLKDDKSSVKLMLQEQQPQQWQMLKLQTSIHAIDLLPCNKISFILISLGNRYQNFGSGFHAQKVINLAENTTQK